MPVVNLSRTLFFTHASRVFICVCVHFLTYRLRFMQSYCANKCVCVCVDSLMHSRRVKCEIVRKKRIEDN